MTQTFLSKRRPCKTCPWRKDAELGYWHQDHYRDMAKSCQRDGPNQMMCHQSRDTNQIVCAGWVLVLGFDAIGVRRAVHNGDFDPNRDFESGGLELYDSWEEMAEANGVYTPDYRVGSGRDWHKLSPEEQEERRQQQAKELRELWTLNGSGFTPSEDTMIDLVFKKMRCTVCKETSDIAGLVEDYHEATSKVACDTCGDTTVWETVKSGGKSPG